MSGYSLMDMSNSTKQQAEGSIKTLANMEQNREIANDNIKQQKKTNKLAGAASGAAIGTMVMPGVGTAVGAAIGFLAGSL